MKFQDSMIMYTPNSGNIKIMHRDIYLKEVKDNNVRKKYKSLYSHWFSGRDDGYKNIPILKQKMMAYFEAIHLVVHDNVDSDAVREAFLDIDEYVDIIAGNALDVNE